MKRSIMRLVWIMVVSLTPFLAVQVLAAQGGAPAASQTATQGEGSETWRPESERMHPWVGMREHWRKVPRMLTGKIYLWEQYIIGHRHALGLTDQQVNEIGARLIDQRKSWVKKRADQTVLFMEIEDLLLKEPLDLIKVEEKVKAIQALSAEMFMEDVRTLDKVLSVLTPEQRKTVEEFMRESTFARRIMAY